MKVPREFEPDMLEDLRRDLWKVYGRNDKERWKAYKAELKRDAEKRKRKDALRSERRKPVPKTPKPEAPERTTHNFPYLVSRDIPENGCRRATIIGPPEIIETKWGKRYCIALEFSDHDKRRWNMNNTTYCNLSDRFGANGSEWVG